MELFNFSPTSEPKITEGYRVVSSDFESGTKRRYYKGRKGKLYSLVFQTNYENACDLMQFWRDRKGPYEAFLYEDPHSGELVVVHFSETNVDFEAQWNASHEYKVGIIEVVLEELL